MTNIDPFSSTARSLWNRLTSSLDPHAPTPKSATSPTPEDMGAAYDHAVEILPAPLVPSAALMARLDPVGQKLDDLKATLSGPYELKNMTAESGAQFRMVNGHNQHRVSSSSDDGKLLAKVAAKAGLTSQLTAIQAGRGDARSLVKLTQALIDTGLLEGHGKPFAEQIHDLQWRFAIGLDCAGYVYQAVAKVHGDPAKLGLKVSLNEDFTGLPWNPRFVKKEPAETKPGDVLVLKGAGRTGVGANETVDPGHNLIVRSQRLVSESSDELADMPAAARAFVRGKSDVVMLEVDSSFGAGRFGDPQGGVRRDVLLYDGQTWATCRAVEPRIAVIGPVPYGEKALTGFFRPKVSP